jgi:hypothetical protein
VKILAAIFWLISMAATACAGLSFILDYGKATSAPQQAAVAAVALVFAGLPYVFARALQGLADLSMARDLELEAEASRQRRVR